MIGTTIFVSIIALILISWFVHITILKRINGQKDKELIDYFLISPIAMIIIDKNYRIKMVNPSISKLFGYEANEFLDRNVIDFLIADTDRAYMHTVFLKAIKDGKATVRNYNINRDDKELFCEWNIAVIDNEELLCTIVDLTQMQTELDRLEKTSMALERSSSATIFTDNRSYIEYISPSFEKLFLDDSGDIIGKHIGEYLFGDKVAFSAVVSALDSNNSYRGTITKSSRGEAKTLSVMMSMFTHESRLVSYIVNLHDITYLSTQISDMAYKVQHDALTGAVNRATLNDRLSQAIKRANRFKTKIALFFIDLNDFKIINDTHGHDVGDLLLKSVAKNIIACLRTTDTVCRYGGDEFIAMLEDIRSSEHLDAILNTINIAISEPVKVDNNLTIIPKASVGYALYPDDALSLDELIKVADEAMYIEKKKKKQR